MGSTIKMLAEKQLIQCPSFLPESTHYEVIMGSFAYGVSSDTSDMDVYGFCIPDKEMLFPHLKGEILGFGHNSEPMKPWQQHHIKYPEALGGSGRIYDCSIYSVVQYLDLLMGCNPNIIDSLFVPERCVLFTTPIGQMVRDFRKEFLQKRCWHTFKGYAVQQVKKLNIKNPTEGKRKDLVDAFGYDVKFAYHIVRLLNEVEQILIEGDLDLERNREQLKSIRRGEWPKDDLLKYTFEKSAYLEKVYTESKLPKGPDVEKIRELLFNILEQHFGSLKGCVIRQEPAVAALREIQDVLDRYKMHAITDS